MVCNKCNSDKDTDQFNEDQKGNKRKDCKACQSLYNRNYYANNKEKILDYQETFRLNNNEQIMKARKKRASNLNATILKIVNEVNTKRGAPMGRHDVGKKPIDQKIFDCYLPMCIGDGAYDKGGAYWGLDDNRIRVSYTKDLLYIKFYRENDTNT